MNPGSTTSVGRRDPLCRWTAKGAHEIVDVFVDDRFHSEAGRSSESKILDVNKTTRPTLQLKD